MITRLSFFLVAVALIITTSAPQGSAKKISASRTPDPRDSFIGCPTRDKSILWRVHLALQLVKHPELNERQVQIILDAISLSTPEFFAASNKIPAKSKADEDLESLIRRAFAAFPNSQAADLFRNIVDRKDEEGSLKVYFDLAALPLKQRRTSFRKASSNEKSILWRTHLALFLVKRPELNERQKDIILAAMSLATPNHFGIRSSESASKTKGQDPLRSLEEKIVVAFSLEDATKIFATLGDDTQPANPNVTNADSVLLKSISYKLLNPTGEQGKDNDRVPSLDLDRSSCQCSTVSDYCPIWSICTAGNCKSTDSGCGTLWSHPCNGLCKKT